MKSTQRKVSGDPIPTRSNGFVFAVKAFLLRRRRALRDLFHPLPRSKPRSEPVGGVLLGRSVSQLRYAEQDTARELIDGKIHNLRLAIRRIDGIVVRRGRVFSFWRHVGRLTRGRGYVNGRELREGCIIPQVGGGICQLSNAIYDAALKAGLYVVERHPHSAVIKGSLAESGRDATVFWNYLDLRLRGEQNWQLRAEMDGEQLTVSIFGEYGSASGDCSEERCAPTPLGDCSTCGRTDCYLCVTGKLRDDARTTWLTLEEDWPEFVLWRERNLRPEDRVLATGDSLGGRWCELCSKVRRRYVLWLGRREIARGGVLARRDDGRWRYSWRRYPIPVAQNARYELLARHFARRLQFSDTHLVIPQPLLVPLYAAGELAGRTYDVLMSALPIPCIERRLDEAMERAGFRIDRSIDGSIYEATDPANPCSENGVTLGDFRAPLSLVETERAALAGAARLISPHRCILREAGRRGVELDWIAPEPVALKSVDNQRFIILLAGASLGRKGIFELRTALRRVTFDYELLLVGSATESDDFWQGMAVRTVCSHAEGVAMADVVVLPAVVEHNPRTILLAIASGKPVIVSDACGLPTDSPGLYRADDARQLEATLAALAEIHPAYEPSTPLGGRIRLSIDEVYPGTEYDDTCISEIILLGGGQ